MKPTIGRIVHYTNLGDRDGKYPPEVQAAIITGVRQDGPPANDNVSLHVFYKTGAFDLAACEYAGDDVVAGTEQARGKWQWPAREA